MTGKLYGVSVGPGDPELITLKGIKAIQAADVVAFPAGRNGKPGMAETIAQNYIQPHQERLPWICPMYKIWKHSPLPGKLLLLKLYTHLSRDRQVVFISEGDASFYSTFTYLMLTLRQKRCSDRHRNYSWRLFAVGGGGRVGFTLTIWAEKLAVLPLLHNLSELETALDWADTVVLMKVNRYYPQVWQILRSRHLLQHSYIVVRQLRASKKSIQIYLIMPICPFPTSLC
jgi:precorrin-2/cobalt-factor-2 C20-methyltransferase